MSVSISHDQGGDAGKLRMQADAHAADVLYLPAFERRDLQSCRLRRGVHVVVSFWADRNQMPPLLTVNHWQHCLSNTE